MEQPEMRTSHNETLQEEQGKPTSYATHGRKHKSSKTEDTPAAWRIVLPGILYMRSGTLTHRLNAIQTRAVDCTFWRLSYRLELFDGTTPTIGFKSPANPVAGPFS